jgi:hypothetical protein
MRMALHPQDLSRAAIQASLVRSLDRWLSLHSTTTYAELREPAGPVPISQ